MGVRVLYNSDSWDAATITSSSETGDLADDNVVNDQVAKPWRATGDSAEWIKFDLGSAKDITCIGLFGGNWTSAATITLEGNATDSWGAPTYSQVLTVETDEDSVVFKQIVLFLDETFRWWRITFADAANPDGYIEVGRIKAGEYYEPTRTYSEGWSFVPVDPSEGDPKPGVVSVWRTRAEFRQVAVRFRFMNETQFKKFWTMYRKVGKRKPIILALKSTTEPTIYSLYCTFGGQMPMRNQLVNWFEASNLVFEEKVE
jgi:hypothetical protein